MLNEKLVDEIMLDFRISEVSFDPQAVRRRFSLKFSESKKAGTEIELTIALFKLMVFNVNHTRLWRLYCQLWEYMDSHCLTKLHTHKLDRYLSETKELYRDMEA